MTEPAALEQVITSTWDFEDAEGSEGAFARAADDAGRTTMARLVLRTQVARAKGLGGDLAGAHGILDAIEADLEASAAEGEQRDHVTARIAIERGRVLNSGGDPALAQPLFEQAYDFSGRAGVGGLAVDALHMMAIVASQTEGPGASAQWNERAIHEAERSSDPEARRWLPSLLNNLAWDRHDAGEHAEALELFQRALAGRAESGKQPELNIARWSVARALRSLGRHEEALAIQSELAADPHSADDPYVYEELGENLTVLGRAVEARDAFAKWQELSASN